MVAGVGFAMEYSKVVGTGGKHILKEAATWLVALSLSVTGIYFHKDIAKWLEGPIGQLLSADSNHASSNGADGLTNRSSSSISDAERSLILRAGANGHFNVTAYVDGRPAPFLVDTGASMVYLNYETARDLGLTGGLEYTGRARTANGIVKFAFVNLSRVQVGEIQLRDVRGAVSMPGARTTNLLGMSFLRKLSRFEMRGENLVLVQ